MVKPKLLIITGPQGSGNHLFAKIFSSYKSVYGWKMKHNEWQGHHDEPFSIHWRNPSLLNEVSSNRKYYRSYYVTSISCPYVIDKKFATPKYHTFINQAKKYADVQVAIIGRDKNILKHQQIRVRRGEYTTPMALQNLNLLPDAFYLSQELFFLYGINYLRSVSKQLDFPISFNSKYINRLLKTEANNKYIKPAKKGRFDNYQFKINY